MRMAYSSRVRRTPGILWFLLVTGCSGAGRSAASGGDASTGPGQDGAVTAQDAAEADTPSDVIVELDAGSFLECMPPQGSPSDVCLVCESLDASSLPRSPCNVEGLRCGLGCTLNCFCQNGQWGCEVPPCR
jgi:hypothetical protein